MPNQNDQQDQTPPRALFAAWLRVKSAVKMPALDSKNPHFGNKYASLGACLDAVRPALAAEKINYQQVFDGEKVRTIVFDADGNSLSLSTFPITEGLSPQATGSALTYAKRQALCIDFGVVGEPDDDGEEATKEAVANGNATKLAAYRARVASLFSQLRETEAAEEALQIMNERGGVRATDTMGEQELLELGTSLSQLMQRAEAARREIEEA